jgi:murein L,D-transpeptidase YafK
VLCVLKGASAASLTAGIDVAVRKYGTAATARLQPFFEKARVPYPPRRVTLLAFKEERSLEVWASSRAEGGFRFIREYPILAASGKLGPKLRQGDLQVPEGFYRILWLNPYSQYHLSMKVNYPNAFDFEMARSEKRTNLGGDIFIHGNQVSAGCLAMGDEAIEELFVLVERTSPRNVDVLISPLDLRRAGSEWPRGGPKWAAVLYVRLAAALSGFERRR